MTVEERLLFIRAGYSAQDIAAFEEAETGINTPAPVDDPEPDQDDPEKPEETPAPAPAPEQEQEPAWAAALRQSIDNLTKAQQASNARFDDMGDPMSVQDQAEAALAEYLTGKKPEAAQQKNTNTKGVKRK